MRYAAREGLFSWTNDTDVLTTNADGFLAAAHVYVSLDGTRSGGAALTGFAANGEGTPPVPEPIAALVWSLLIASTGLVTLRQRLDAA